jgi:hypothetical protein
MAQSGSPTTSRAGTGDADMMMDLIGWFVMTSVPSGSVRIPPPASGPRMFRFIETTSNLSNETDCA